MVSKVGKKRWDAIPESDSYGLTSAKAVLDQTDPPLVIGIIGRGHLEYGHGTPYQLRDLNVDAIKVLLPCTAEELGRRYEQHADCADALFCLDDSHH